MKQRLQMDSRWPKNHKNMSAWKHFLGWLRIKVSRMETLHSIHFHAAEPTADVSKMDIPKDR